MDRRLRCCDTIVGFDLGNIAGDDAKALVDQWTDACAAVINLRTAIMRYRKPRSSARFYRCAASPSASASACSQAISSKARIRCSCCCPSISIAGQYLRQWSNSLLAQWRMEDLAQLNNEMRVSHMAFGWLHRLRLRAIETRGREANAQLLRRFYEKRRSLAVLRRWREMAAKRNHHTRREPSSVGSKKRDLSFDADLPFEASLARAEDSTHIHQGVDPRPWVAANDTNISTTLFSDYLSTPSKRATRAKELMGPSTTPAGTPFGSGLRSLFTTSQSQRKRELGKSTNLGRSAFETIPEVSPRTPSA